MAGIIDGEGWISRSGKNGVRVCVGNTSQELIEWLAQCGGLVFQKKKQVDARVRSQKTQWMWSVGRAVDCLMLLEALAPYLTVKKRLAEDVIESLKFQFSRTH